MTYTGLVAEGENLPIEQMPAEQLTQEEVAKMEVQEKFLKHDPDGYGMTLIAMTVVFSALILLSIIFIALGRFNTWRAERGKRVPELARSLKGKSEEGAVAVAIALALRDYDRQLHDEEQARLTIEQISRRYSPWSSKSHSVLHNQLRR